MQQGHFYVYRSLWDKAIYKESTPVQKVILWTLLKMADYKGNEWEYKGEKYITKPGQFITSLPSIVEEAGIGVSIQNVRTALKRFEKLGFLTCESTNRNRLITITNWDKYQNLGGNKEDNLTGQNGQTNRQPNRQTNRQDTPPQEASYQGFVDIGEGGLTGKKERANRQKNKQLTANKNLKTLRPFKNITSEKIPDDFRMPKNAFAKIEQRREVNNVSDRPEEYALVEVSKDLKPVEQKQIGGTVVKYSETDMELAVMLDERIRDNFPRAKKPNLHKWANTFRLMRERDDVPTGAIEFLIDWTQQHHFWHMNILSAEKLRQQYHKLVLQVKAERNNTKSFKTSRPTTSDFDKLREKLKNEGK